MTTPKHPERVPVPAVDPSRSTPDAVTQTSAASPGAETPDFGKLLDEYRDAVLRQEPSGRAMKSSKRLKLARETADARAVVEEYVASLQARAVRGERERDEAVEDFADYLMTQFGGTIQREKLPGITKHWLRMQSESRPPTTGERRDG